MLKKIVLLSVAAWLSVSASAQQPHEHKKQKASVDFSKLPAAAERQGLNYTADIKPILDHSCIRCHGEDKPKARLRLDSLETVLKGSENGKVITPGNPKASLLLINVARIGDPDDYMPPPKNKAGIPALTEEQVRLIRAWIEQGAK